MYPVTAKIHIILYIDGVERAQMTAEVEKEKCTGCGECLKVCPARAIKIEAGKACIDDSCRECGACIEKCPAGAIKYTC